MAFVAGGAEGADQSSIGVVGIVFQMTFGFADVDGAGNESAAFVVLVAGDLPGVFALRELPARVVAVALGSVVEVDLLDQAVHRVIGTWFGRCFH